MKRFLTSICMDDFRNAFFYLLIMLSPCLWFHCSFSPSASFDEVICFQLKDAVSLATLMAVTKAYRDRDRSDSLAMKVDRVMRIQQERMQSRQIVAAYKVGAESFSVLQKSSLHLTFHV